MFFFWRCALSLNKPQSTGPKASLYYFREARSSRPSLTNPLLHKLLAFNKGLLVERILGLVEHAGRLIEADILDTQHGEDIEQSLADMTEGHGTVVRIALAD